MSTLVTFDRLGFSEWLIDANLSARAKQSNYGIGENCLQSLEMLSQFFKFQINMKTCVRLTNDVKVSRKGHKTRQLAM